MASVNGTLAGEVLRGTAGADLINGAAPVLVTATAPQFTTVATGLGQALFATSMPGDTGRMFVADKAGIIRSVDLATGTSSVFLNISAQVSPTGEQGLLGLAFHPEFWANGRFYVFFSNLAGDTVLREYRIDPNDQGAVLAGSARDILTVPQPGTATNHKGGWIGFGPDGALYVATGDGGPGNDPNGTGQDPNDLLGAILRIDVDTDGFPADPDRNHAIPADNPFASGGGAPEVWAYGLRNPFRDSFDRGDGRLWIGDVGQARREEINIGASGANFGWSIYEGDLVRATGAPAGTLPPGITGPAFTYDRSANDRSVVGGYVHRGPDSGLQGEYVFGDFISGRIWTLSDADGNGTLAPGERTVLDGGTLMGGNALVSFGEDAEGNLYAIGINGRLLRLQAGTATGDLDGGDTIVAGAGDDRVFAGAGDDSVLGGTGANLLSGMEGRDTLVGGGVGDTLIGGAAEDVLSGSAGNDLLLGGAAADRLVGGAGDDLIQGGPGADVMTGGTGADRFRWGSTSESPGGAVRDRVTDFSAAEGDRLDVSALVPGVFTFIGDAPFGATGAQVRAVSQAGSTRFELSIDGGPADLVVLLVAVASVSAADFLL